MPKYQVTLTYLITLNAHDEEDAIWWATQAVESDSDEYNDVEVEEVKCVLEDDYRTLTRLDQKLNEIMMSKVMKNNS